jgi:hypothetical protein
LELAEPRRDGLFTGAWAVVMPAEPPQDTMYLPTVRMDSTGAIVETLGLQPVVFPRRERTSVGGQELTAPSSPSDAPLSIQTPDGSYLVRRSTGGAQGRATFTVARMVGLADTVFHLEVRYEPKDFDPATLDSLLFPYAGRYVERTGMDTAAVADALRRALTLPAHQPPISYGRVGQDTTLWLRREEGASAMYAWVVISPQGEPRGTFVLPRSATILWTDGDEMWVSLPDDLEVPWLVKYRLEGGG